MKAEFIRKSAGYAGLKLKDLAEATGQSQNNFHNKLSRGGVGISTDEELEKMAQRMGATYHCYFEFPDGVRIGDFPGKKEAENE